ncbi:LytR/AlgR family response regulator transcription factor [Vibrio methylphosphonaticus]|uniref:LytR/AlgR family response regulator transcription factor n=1 Tax=Vibrio methylphosphonaticus TaxID=2946866 RepID=UPI00202A6D8A|nr:LytTR family DNA-binding domain-containing protein [Vibrio methylphosphonaticus]MCL9776266.1 LytTR family DNA-binding domain-containing protein [Vibrio methylphosphonaticus]
MNSVTAIIADDEPLLRFHLDKMLAETWPELTIVDTCENGERALEAIKVHQPSVAFLDIQMPGMTGIDVANRVVALEKKHQLTAPLIVFVTAFDQYAISAFEANAIDYVLKPVQEDRLLETCQRVKQRLSSSDSDGVMQTLMAKIEHLSVGGTKQYTKWIKATKQDEIHVLAVDDIVYAKAEDKYITLVVSSDQGYQEYILRSSIKELTSQLDSDLFWQIHRSTLINVNRLDKVKKDITGKMFVYIAGTKLPVSRAMQSLFR